MLLTVTSAWDPNSATAGSACPPLTGSSVSDPAYFSLPESKAGEQEKELKAMDDVPKVSPARKAQLLKMSTKKVELEPQGGSHYVPPGSSMSDPHYSIKDPVYFVDGSKAP